MGLNIKDCPAAVKVCGKRYPVRVWDGVAEPLDGKLFAIDTETHLIEGYTIPPLVIMQVFNGESVDIVPHYLVHRYLTYIEGFNSDVKYLMQNAPFDLDVLCKHMNDVTLLRKMDRGEVIDIGVRHALHKVAVMGYYERPLSLENMAKIYMHWELPKPEDIRLTFRQDRSLSREHLQYAAIDPIVT